MNSYKISNIPGGARVILIPNESRKLACISVLYVLNLDLMKYQSIHQI